MTYENDWRVVAYILLLSLTLLLTGLFSVKNKSDIRRIYRHSGRLVADFIILDGLPVTLFNMGTLGIAATAYILLTGGTINGATLGGILTIIGFGAFGKHLRNILPIMGGVIISARWSKRGMSTTPVCSWERCSALRLHQSAVSSAGSTVCWSAFCIRRWCSIQVFCTEDLTCITTDFPQASLR